MNRPPSSIDRSASASAASACPGLLRIVPARDGGICRVRLPAGRLAIEQALTLAAAAAQYGSGVLEITNRANLQVRGVAPAHAELLIDSLLAAGLGPSVAGVATPGVATSGADDVRNLLVSPTAGIDAGALLDVRPLAAEILELLQARPDLHRLSPKFALQLDGGEHAAMLEHPHDLWLAVLPGGEQLALGLAGCPPLPGDAKPALAALPARHAPELIETALRLFLECASATQTRMRHLLDTLPAAEFLSRLQARLSFPLRTDAALARWRRPDPIAGADIGIHAQRDPAGAGRALCYVGAKPVLGRIDSAQLRSLALLAREYDGELRLTPWQGVVVANVAAAQAAQLAQQLERAGFNCDVNSVLAHAIACSGATGCAKGRADTKRDARLLGEWLQRYIAGRAAVRAPAALPSIHLTGCERSCAAAHRAAFTLLALEPGRYALHQRVAGIEGFGRVLAPSTDIENAGELIAGAFFKNDFTPEVNT